MKINSNTLNGTTFGSIYKFNVSADNYTNYVKNELGKKEISDCNGFQIYNDFSSIAEIKETGIFEKIHISADDKYDNFIESLLIQNNIDFKKQSHENALQKENIYNRTVLSERAKNCEKILVGLDVNKIEELFKNDMAYISQNGETGAISNRYKKVKEYLATGRDIDATEAYLSDNNGELSFSVIDGRHRFAVMRDMGMDKVKIALDKNSFEIAMRYGLIKE